jgi:gas vesicle protein
VAQTVGAAIAGATVGYVAGTLTAPASGKETRRRIGRGVEKGAEEVTRKAEEISRKADEITSRAKHAVRDAREKLAKVVQG